MTEAGVEQKSWLHLVRRWDCLQHELDGMATDPVSLNRRAEIGRELADLRRCMGAVVEAGRVGRTAPLDELKVAVFQPDH